MSTKIQINSLEALERLLGGDTELEIEVRNSVIQRFAEKHLKPLANGDGFKAIGNQIRKDANDNLSREIASFKEGWNGNLTDIKIKPEIKEEIDRHVRSLVDEKIRDAIREATQFWANEKEINTRIKRMMDGYNEQTIKDEVKKRIEDIKKKL